MQVSETTIAQVRAEERIFYGWFIVAILFFISLIDGGFGYIFSAFLKPLAEEFGWTRAQTSGAFSLYLLAAGLTLPLWGWLADTRGVRVVFLLSALIDGVALLLLSTVDSLAAFYTVYFFLGVGLGGIGPATVGKVISQWFVAKRGRAMGIALVGAGAGGLVFVPLSGLLIAASDWRAAYQVLAALALGGMLPFVWFFLTDTPQEKGLMPLGHEHNNADTVADEENDTEVGDWTLAQALRTRTFWCLGLAFCCGIMAGTAINAHQVAFLQDTGLTLEMASTVAGISLGMSMAGRFAVGWVSERLSHLHHIVALSLLLQAIGIGCLLLQAWLGLWVLALFVPLFGVGLGGLVVLWPLVIGHDFGVRSFGAIAGMLGTVALTLGGALGPVIVGAMYDNTGSYHGAFVLCTMLMLAGAGIVALAPEPHARHPVIISHDVTHE